MTLGIQNMPIEKLRPSFTFTEDRLKELQAVVPEAFADSKINWDTLREALGEHLEDETKEHFGLFWPGKREARRLAAMPSKGTLIPQPGEGVDEENTHNIFIEGDNLEVLKLLQKSYVRRVKLIYIDPPYNTGNDFVYPDDYREPLESYLQQTGQMDETGQMLTTNSRAGGRFHSNWLNMMYPRLLLARQLLRDDGIIFVSIDDNEVNHLRLLMNEIFGEENCFSTIIVQSNKRGQTYKQISKTHEYLIAYTTTPETEIMELEKEGEKDDLNLEDKIGRFNIRELRNRNPKFGRFNRPNLYYPIYVNPKVEDKDGFLPISLEKTKEYSVEVFPLNSTGGESCWRWGKDTLRENIQTNTLESNTVAQRKRNGEYGIYEKYRKTTYKAKSIWFEDEVVTEKGTIELRELGLGESFDFPKPTFLIKKVLKITTGEDDLVLDFFAGSSTTAQAVIEQNQEDGQNRSFIMVQLPERTNDLKLPTIADVSRERIRRVVKKIKSENNRKPKLDKDQDIGFSSYQLLHSNFSEWKPFSGNNTTQLELRFGQAETPLIEGWTPENLLTEILLLQGYPLDSKVRFLPEFKANEVKQVTSEFVQHPLYVCLDKKIKDDTVAKLKLGAEDIFVCLDSALTDEVKVKLSDQCNLKVI
jgi:adenine-specific DNA-methyltransferase